jgi:predicted O-linked N-acetylglucosamine transferase (SPINDLY family)
MTSKTAQQKQQLILQKAIALQESGHLAEATHSYKKLLKLTPKDTQLLNTLGMLALQLDNFKEGLNWLEQSLKINPNQPHTLSNCGYALQELKRYEKALAYHDHALALKPDYIDAHYNRGLALQALKRYEEALLSFDNTIALYPNDADAYYNRSISLKELKRYDEALISIDQAIDLQPNYADAYCNRGTILKSLNQYDEALICLDKALSLKSDYIEALFNRGTVLYLLKRYEDALININQAITLNPNYAEAYFIKGIVLQELKHFSEALRSYDLAIILNPDMDLLQGQRLFTKMQVCDWNKNSMLLTQLTKKIANHQHASEPFAMIALTENPAIHRKTAEIHVKAEYPSNCFLPNITPYPKHPRIRIGYFSADFRNHPVAYLTAELFELHDRNKYEIYAFSFGLDTKDVMRKRLETSFDHFFDVQHLSDKDIALLAREHKIDIAVDLGGYTQYCRTNIFKIRAAPVQLSYIGFLGTMGAEFIDYLIADSTIIPDDYQKYYSEKIIYLPSYQVNDSNPHISEEIYTRQDFGLPETAFIFCCFNNNYKMTPNTFDSWSRILKQVNNSVLFLYADNVLAETNLKKEISLRGLSPNRLVFGKHLLRPEYLARYRVANLFLDTLPYNAGTTGSDALRMGLPVLTCMGTSFASRVAASLLKAVGLPELITSTQARYEELAIDLANHPDKLNTLKIKLQHNLPTSPLYDSRLFTKHIESAYLTIYERQQNGLPPDHIYVDNKA